MQKIKILPTLLLILLGIYLTTYCLQHNPSSWFDEGIYIQIANNFAAQNKMAVQTAPGVFEPLTIISVGYPVFYTTAVFYKVLGVGFIQARYVAVFFLLLFIITFFFLNKSLYNKKIATLSTFLLIFFAPLYGNGRNLLGDIPGLFFMTAGLLSFFYWEKENFQHKKHAILAGLNFGLAAATKPNFLVLGGGILLTLFISKKKIKKKISQVSLFIVSGLIPFFWWFYTQFNSINAFRSALAHYSNPYAKDNISELIIQNLFRFFTESTPIHFTILLLFLIAAVILHFKQYKKISGTKIIIYFFIVFTFLSYLRTPGWYRYFFMAHIWLIFTFVHSLDTLLQTKHKQNAYKFSTGAVLVLITIQGFHLFKTDMSCHESSIDHGTKFMNDWVEEKDNVLLVNTPELTARLNSHHYYQYLEINQKIKLGKEQLEFTKQNMYNKIILRDNELNPLYQNMEFYELKEKIGSYEFYQIKQMCHL
ncbi:MAG: phospholipid carrier-dependent glycosyltransferase [Candidatus Magasanikbacteria bacterium]|jgi:4-amino-4-deoxy-L-arabinose transferase-like glycosyltransferase|nr:phospholipid carrier-dependent glycosyltransferase [Candidatus Magasanikbacteria bacterium]